jgi:hypothetical protein
MGVGWLPAPTAGDSRLSDSESHLIWSASTGPDRTDFTRRLTLIGQHLGVSALDAIDNFARHLARVGLRRVDMAEHFGVGVAQVHPRDQRALLLELDAQRIGCRPDGSLGVSVATHAAKPGRHRMDVD